MTNLTESGHAKNTAKFNDLLSICTGFGGDFNPSKPAIQLNQLSGLDERARQALHQVNQAKGEYHLAVAAREVAFEPLSRLATRVYSAFQATDTSARTDETVRSLVHKIHGVRAKPKKNADEKAEALAKGIEIKEISVSQMGFDNRIDFWDKLIALLENEPLYAPNEEELKISALKAVHNELIAKNKKALAASLELNNARIHRNEILYKPLSGLLDVVSDVKVYVRSLYGSLDPRFKQVSALRFKALKQ